MNNQKLWMTEINAFDSVTNELKLYKGPNIPAENIEEAIRYCMTNGLGYCKVTGGPLIILQFNDRGEVNLDKSIIPDGFDPEMILAISNHQNKQMEKDQQPQPDQPLEALFNGGIQPDTNDCSGAMTVAPATVTRAPQWNSIKEFRQVIDHAMNSFPYLRSSREISLAFTSLQRAFSWLGLAQACTGSQTPYTESENPSSTVIEPTADHTDLSFIERWNPLGTHTARVKDFRAILSDIIADFKLFRKNAESYGRSYDQALDEVYVSIRDAKNWLGWELARIKKELEPKTSDPASAPTTPLPL